MPQLIFCALIKVGVNDVLIKVDQTGICGTDIHIYEWDTWVRKQSGPDGGWT